MSIITLCTVMVQKCGLRSPCEFILAPIYQTVSCTGLAEANEHTAKCSLLSEQIILGISLCSNMRVSEVKVRPPNCPNCTIANVVVFSWWDPPHSCPSTTEKLHIFACFVKVQWKFLWSPKKMEKKSKIIPIRNPGHRFPSSTPTLPDSGHAAPAAQSGCSSACRGKNHKASGSLHRSQVLLRRRLEVVVVLLFLGGPLQKCLYSLCHPRQPSLF